MWPFSSGFDLSPTITTSRPAAIVVGGPPCTCSNPRSLISSAPLNSATLTPWRNIWNVGIDRIPHIALASWFASTSTLAKSTNLKSPESAMASNRGPIILQGPHQEAVKSIARRRPLFVRAIASLNELMSFRNGTSGDMLRAAQSARSLQAACVRAARTFSKDPMSYDRAEKHTMRKVSPGVQSLRRSVGVWNL